MEEAPKPETKNALGIFQLKFQIIYVIIKIKVGYMMEKILEEYHSGTITLDEMIDKLYDAFSKYIIKEVERRTKIESNLNE